MENIINLLGEQEKTKIKIIKLAKSKILFHEEETCDCIGVILKGNISISTYSLNGNEIIYNSLNVGEIFGNNLVFSNDPKYKGSIIAKEDSEIALIYKKELLEILQNNKQFLVKYLEIQSNFGKTLNSKFKLLTMDSVEDKLFFYLSSNGGEIEINSITYLADILYAKRETISRLISRLVKEGRIIRNGKKISIKK